MNIKIENVGILKHADIKLNGLTLIAGENDTGKSTVGKLLFSIVKAVSRYEQDLIESKEKTVFRKIEKLYFKIRKEHNLEKADDLKEEFFPPRFSRQIRPYVEKTQSTEQESLVVEFINEVFLKKENFLNQLEHSAELVSLLDDIKKEILFNEAKGETILRAFSKSLLLEFFGEVSPKNFADTSRINCFEGENQILSVSIQTDKISSFNLHDVLPFNDVTFVESPLLLQMFELVNYADTVFDVVASTAKKNYGRPKTSLHNKDLLEKLKSSKYFTEELQGFHSQIEELINGSMEFEERKEDFFFIKRTNTKPIKIRSFNTASGIKSFGLIQLLLKSNIVNDQSLLIIDEPENHLHPKWQIEYARLIVDMVKADIPVLICSHSPYMIQAINHFSEKEKITDRVNYYLAETNTDDGSASIDDVTDDLNRIFVKLAEPLHKLVWK